MVTYKNLTLLIGLPNIGDTLAKQLNNVGITNYQELKATGSRNALQKIALLDNNGACLSMLYALEGAIQGIRWHALPEQKKFELKEFYKRMLKKDRLT
jgi:DNA transformation protein